MGDVMSGVSVSALSSTARFASTVVLLTVTAVFVISSRKTHFHRSIAKEALHTRNRNNPNSEYGYA